MAAYYNEADAYRADWLRNLIARGLIEDGEVDSRSIVDVDPADVAGFTHCHFFAGIGGWAYAADLAAWPRDRELWTGSTPCQPFSRAGLQRGTHDARHLWPYLFDLVRARRPACFMAEQVVGAVGTYWLDGVLRDLEAIAYAAWPVVIPACAVNAPHRRERLWLVADTDEGRRKASARPNPLATTARRKSTRRHKPTVQLAARRSFDAWRDAESVIGHDGKTRRVKRGVPLLAHGLPGRVAQVRAFGDSLVPQVAAEVIAAYLER